MKALIPAAGFGTRLRPLTNDIPKSLLPLCGRKVIDEQLAAIVSANLSEIFIVTNSKFRALLENWQLSSSRRARIKIMDDGVKEEIERKGAVGDLAFFIEKANPKDSLFVLGSDNLFEEDFNGIINFFSAQNEAIVVAISHLKNANLSRQPNEVSLDSAGRIIDFREKPVQPKSPYFASLLYLLPESKLSLAAEYTSSRRDPDNAGNLIAWLVEEGEPVFGYKMKGRRFDIGDPKSYHSTQRDYPCIRT